MAIWFVAVDLWSRLTERYWKQSCYSIHMTVPAFSDSIIIDNNSNYGQPKAISFHPNRIDHIMLVFQKAVLFLCWTADNGGKLSQPVVPVIRNKHRYGTYTDGIYLKNSHDAIVSTTEGCMLCFGNSLYAKPYTDAANLRNDKFFVNAVKIAASSVNCVTTCDGQDSPNNWISYK